MINRNHIETAPYIPESLTMQWHITDRCNNRCKHCYQDSFAQTDLGFDKLLIILEQYKGLLKLWRKDYKKAVKSRITVTGGEPFMREDFFRLLSIFNKNMDIFSFSVLTNGSFLDKEVVKRLKKTNPDYVQLSIEGGEKTHDHIRGKGDYKRTVSAIKNLTQARIKTILSFTAHSDNYREFRHVAALGKKLKVFRVWSDRLIPNEGAHQTLSPKQTKAFFQIMGGEKRKAEKSFRSKTKISMFRALQFLMGGDRPYRCTAGDSLITVLSNGDLVPCRRMPVKTGNLFDESLTNLYYESILFRKLRSTDTIGENCKSCFYKKICRGGLRCLAYSIKGDPFATDPGCWLQNMKDKEITNDNFTCLNKTG